MNTGNREYFDKIKSYLDESFFDFASMPTKGLSSSIDETQLAKMFARIAVSAVTIVTTTVSLKQYFKDNPIFTRKKNIL
jgi:hypothetical protein